LVNVKSLELPKRVEEKEANRYSREFLVSQRQNCGDIMGSHKNICFKSTKKSTKRNIRKYECGRREKNGV